MLYLIIGELILLLVLWISEPKDFEGDCDDFGIISFMLACAWVILVWPVFVANALMAAGRALARNIGSRR